MACNNTCCNFRYITSATIVDSKLVLGLNTALTGEVDKNKACFRFSSGVTLPTGYETLPVYVSVNGTNTAVLNRYADTMLGSDLVLNSCGGACCRYVYKGYYGTTPTAHLIWIDAPRVTFC